MADVKMSSEDRAIAVILLAATAVFVLIAISYATSMFHIKESCVICGEKHANNEICNEARIYINRLKEDK